MNTPTPKDDGGPAFPVTYDHQIFSPKFVAESRRLMSGMSMRDYFAARFMERAQSLSETGDGGWDYHNAAQCAYAMADAMIEARKA